TRWQASIRHDDRRSRARWNVDRGHKSSIWFSTTDGARELVCADVALSGNHCELRKRPFWKLLVRADAVIDHSDASSIALHLTVDQPGSSLRCARISDEDRMRLRRGRLLRRAKAQTAPQGRPSDPLLFFPALAQARHRLSFGTFGT